MALGQTNFRPAVFKTLRNKERIRTKFQVSGSMYVLAAAIICTLLFPNRLQPSL